MAGRSDAFKSNAAVRPASVLTAQTDPTPPQHRGVLWGSIMCFLSVSGAVMTYPFQQARRDALGCDALCQGGQTSLRSGLTLLGAALIGRASDRFGRVPMLWIGLVGSLISLAISWSMDSINGMWYALVPAALLDHNFGVAKALLSDYVNEQGGTDVELAGAVGKLGMAIGLSFIAGPLLATSLAADFAQAIMLSAFVTIASGCFILFLPTTKKAVGAGSGSGAALFEFMQLPVLRKRGAQLLLCMRLLMALAYHIFSPIWQVSIRERFAFGAKDHAQFMGLIGLFYALSQGVVAKPLIRASGRDPTKLLLCCIMLLGGVRPFALFTRSISMLYLLYMPMVIALGVMNTAITSACSSLAGGDQLGGLFGVLEAVESLAGMIGPAIGGLLSRGYAQGPIGAVCALYGLAALLVFLFFEKHVSGHKPQGDSTSYGKSE